MNSPLIQLLVLAGIAIFLILRLKNVLGSRDGFEKPQLPKLEPNSQIKPELEVIEGGPDLDIIDHVPEDSKAAQALTSMKRIETSFDVTDFLQGARGAYEMIVMGFEQGNLSEIQPLLSEDIYESFVNGVAAREDQGLKIEAVFIGVSETKLLDATFNKANNEAELTIRFAAELNLTVWDQEGNIVEGGPTKVKKQKDTWSFVRIMGADNPNWLLVSTDA